MTVLRNCFCFRRRLTDTSLLLNVVFDSLKQSSSTSKLGNLKLNCDRTRFSEPIFLFKIARWTFTCFWLWYLGSLWMCIKCWVNLEKRNGSRSEGTVISKANLVFDFLQRTLWLSLKCGFRVAQTCWWNLHSSSEVTTRIFLCEFPEKRKFLRLWFFGKLTLSFDCLPTRILGSARRLF